jgi:TonB family protein
MPLYEQEQNRSLGIRKPSAYAQLTPEQKQRRQMLAALGLLVLALALVIIKDRDFWFPPSPVAVTAPSQQPVASQATPVEQTQAKNQPVLAHKSKKHPKVVAAAIPPATTASAPITPVVTNRAVLPPLEIEVIAGDQHETAQEKNNSVGLAMGSGASSSTQTATTNDVVSNASQNSERVHLSTDTTQVVAHPVEPNYPMLAKEMKVQGSVVLEALIGKNGQIQSLRTVSGPTILSNAAREAVQQWRFKPYYQSGQPVDTVARITVNFTISAN